MTTAALGEGSKLAAWHLQLLGVRAEYQNKGVGLSLLKAMELKVSVCLSTLRLSLLVNSLAGFPAGHSHVSRDVH
jgi:hypothetical protein